MNIKKAKNIVIKKFQKEILFMDIESDADKKKSVLCNDYRTRSCLSCSSCWVKR